jgi:hypothetical protein
MKVRTALIAAFLGLAPPVFAQGNAHCLGRVGAAPGGLPPDVFTRCIREIAGPLVRLGTMCDVGHCPIKTVRPTDGGLALVLDIDIPVSKEAKPLICGPDEEVTTGTDGKEKCVPRKSSQAKDSAQAAMIAGIQVLIARYQLPVKLEGQTERAKKAIASVGK